MLTSDCFEYSNPGKPKTQAQQNKAGIALPLDEREVAWGAERRQSGVQDLPPRKKYKEHSQPEPDQLNRGVAENQVWQTDAISSESRSQQG